jgi:hypothetical protein
MRERDGVASMCPYLTWIELSQEKGADGSTLPFGDGARKKIRKVAKKSFRSCFRRRKSVLFEEFRKIRNTCVVPRDKMEECEG